MILPEVLSLASEKAGWTEAALRKLVAKYIASDYFGQNITPEIASQIVEKAAEGFKEALENEE